MQAFASYLCSTVHVAHAHRVRGSRWADDPAAIEAMKRKVPETVGACFALIEQEMFRGPWVMGERYTSPTPISSPSPTGSKATASTPAAFPRVLDHRRRMAERPAVKRALAMEAG